MKALLLTIAMTLCLSGYSQDIQWTLTSADTIVGVPDTWSYIDSVPVYVLVSKKDVSFVNSYKAMKLTRTEYKPNGKNVYTAFILYNGLPLNPDRFIIWQVRERK